jgi:hypothetical protein
MANGITNSTGKTIATEEFTDANLELTNAHAQILEIRGKNGELADVNDNGAVYVTMEALSHILDSILIYPRGSDYDTFTASKMILSVPGKLSGIWISSATTSPTIKIWDSTTGTGTVLADTFTPVAGQYYPFPHVRLTVGIYVQVVSGSVSGSVFFDPTTT